MFVVEDLKKVHYQNENMLEVVIIPDYKKQKKTNARANARAGESSKRKWINESNENNPTRNKLKK